ncbi:phospholipase domain-containing protein [Streptomyces sp. 061-3]|uniref:phospholipase domain-containing protein n=1 Tax=Streptomyces sp. 061-3 TaxID=2789268 RepID=UPI00397ED7BE
MLASAVTTRGPRSGRLLPFLRREHGLRGRPGAPGSVRPSRQVRRPQRAQSRTEGGHAARRAPRLPLHRAPDDPCASRKGVERRWSLNPSGHWYDFTVTVDGSSLERRFAGRVETGGDGISDPAMAAHIQRAESPVVAN